MSATARPFPFWRVRSKLWRVTTRRCANSARNLFINALQCAEKPCRPSTHYGSLMFSCVTPFCPALGGLFLSTSGRFTQRIAMDKATYFQSGYEVQFALGKKLGAAVSAQTLALEAFIQRSAHQQSWRAPIPRHTPYPTKSNIFFDNIRIFALP